MFRAGDSGDVQGCNQWSGAALLKAESALAVRPAAAQKRLPRSGRQAPPTH